jgi:peptide/nickel transport system ATP-binding protein
LALLQVEDLSIQILGKASRYLLSGICLSLEEGERVAVVGPSGAGKSLLLLALQGLLPPGVVPARGTIRYGGRVAGERELPWSVVRGRITSYVPQEAALAWHPMQKLRTQVAEAARWLQARDRKKASVEEWLASAAVPFPREHLDRYPHELSGGERRRLLLAIALLGQPRLVLADEPTVGLDPVSAKAFVIELLRWLETTGAALLWVGHDLGYARQVADRWLVVERGELRASGSPEELLAGPPTSWVFRAASFGELSRLP